MSMLSESNRRAVSDRLAAMEHPVRLVNFTQEFECPVCYQTRGLLNDLADCSERLTLEVYDFQRDLPVVTAYEVDKIPATVIEGPPGRGIRFYGLPAGYILGELLETVVAVSRRRSNLQPATVAQLRRIDRPLHVQVFVTPTCPFCPATVRMAARFALESDRVRTDVVDATTFPHLVERYAVRAVPKTVINGMDAVEGVLPEDAYLARILAGTPVPPHRAVPARRRAG